MVTKKIAAFYSLKKSKKVLRVFHRLYLRKAKVLEASSKEKMQVHLKSLQQAILEKNAPLANQIAHQVEQVGPKLIPKSFWDKTRDFVGAILFALIVAVVIRQMWFELYTIPTGSMRPTLKEGDFLVVSKTDFGINIPLRLGHFYFDPNLVQRGSIFVFTSEGMDISDSDMMYFYLFPGKKQMVKRLIAKPGDTLYFYGGELYGVNSRGEDLTMLRSPPWFQTLEHIPFIRFEGTVQTPKPASRGVFPEAIFYQMNQPVAKMEITQVGAISGQMINPDGKEFQNLFDLWGMKHFAMARLLTATEVDQIYPGALRGLENGVLYLELTHHPNIKQGHLVRDKENRLRPELSTSVSFLPLQEEHLQKIMSSMTTSRFSVQNGKASRLGMNPNDPFYQKYFPTFPNVPNGTYEFQNGKASQVYWGGISKELPSSHPLYVKSAKEIQLLYNLGVEFFTQYNPSKQNRAYPSRYAYFRNQDLYLLGAPIVSKQDPALVLFLKREYQKQSIATSVNPYHPFEDLGGPLTKEGHLDVDFIRKYGITLPEKSYLALGDNHAMSADSRQFGFVPEANMKGGVSFLFWPLGSRFGRLPQPIHPQFTLPSLIIWGSAALTAILVSLYLRKKIKSPLKF